MATADAGSAQSTAKNNLLMQLRKCCAHPSLLSASPGIEHGQALSDYVAASGKLALLDQMVCTRMHCSHCKLCVYPAACKYNRLPHL